MEDRILKEKKIRRELDLLLRTGEVLVASGADTNRIIRNMHRTAAFLGLPEENLHIHVTYNMLQVNLSDEEHSLSKFQRCDRHGINMTAITEISQLSWKAIREDYSLDKYEEELEKINGKPRNYTVNQVAVGAGFACGGFCIQFGCDWTAFFYASIAAIVGFRLRAYLNEKGSNGYVNIGIAAFVSTLLAWLSTFISTPAVAQYLPEWLYAILHTDTPWHPLMACALFIVPGVPLINFVSDMIESHIQMGLSRAINTLLMVTANINGDYCVWSGQLCERPQHDATQHIHQLFYSGSNIGNGILNDFQHTEEAALGSRHRRYHRCMYEKLRESRSEQQQRRTRPGTYHGIACRIDAYQHHCREVRACVPCAASVSRHSECHTDGAGSAYVSCAFRTYRDAGRGGRTYRGVL